MDNSVAYDGDACPIQVLLFGTELAEYCGEGDDFASVVWDILEVDGAKGVSSFGALSSSSWSFDGAFA